MKRRVFVALAGALLLTGTMTGCQASKGVETDSVKVNQYKGIEVDKVDDPETVTDEKVEAQIESILKEHATQKEITDREVKDGDTVNIDFAGTTEGKEIEGGTAEGYDLVIGSDSFIDGFEDSVIGHKIGDKYVWSGSFPEEYGSEELAGKPCDFEITVNSIKEEIIPELNDEFVKEVSETSKTVAEYKEELKKSMQEESDETAENELKSSVWDKVMEDSNVEVKQYPEDEVKKYKDQIAQSYESYAEAYQQDLETFISEQFGMTMEQYEEELDKQAKNYVKSILVTNAIADKEKITISDEEFEKKLEEFLPDSGYETVDELKEGAGEDGLEYLKVRFLNEMVVDFLAENCIQVKN